MKHRDFWKKLWKLGFDIFKISIHWKNWKYLNKNQIIFPSYFQCRYWENTLHTFSIFLKYFEQKYHCHAPSVKNPIDDQQFHYYPYHATWKPAEHFPEVDLYGELYTSQQFRDAHDEVQRLPSTPENSGLERVVVALMLSSDATTLTSFGTAQLWPCYLSFGNESKYRRCCPTENLSYQVAYFVTVSLQPMLLASVC